MLISRNDFRRLIKAYDFLLKVRFCLHLISSRRDDALSFNVKIMFRKGWGLMIQRSFPAQRGLCGIFYLKASAVKEIASTISGMCLRQWLITGEMGSSKKEKDNG